MKSSPYSAIWTKPRMTMEGVRPKPNQGLFILSVINGFLMNINFIEGSGSRANISWGWLLLLAIVLSPIIGYIYLSVANLFVFITGKWIGGKATFRESRSALAWSSFPLIVNVVVWFLMFAIVGGKLFTPPTEMLFTQGESFLLLGVSIIQVVFSVWSLILYFNCLAEVQEFSVLKAIGNAVAATILFLIIVIILWFLAVLIGSNLF